MISSATQLRKLDSFASPTHPSPFKRPFKTNVLLILDSVKSCGILYALSRIGFYAGRMTVNHGRRIQHFMFDRIWLKWLCWILIVPESPDPAYQHWLIEHYPNRWALNSLKTKVSQMHYRPLISIVLPVYKSFLPYLSECIESVRRQIYLDWELCIVDDGSREPALRKMLLRFAQRDPRIKIKFRDENGHIVRATNEALALSSGDFVAFLDHDDILPPHALYKTVDFISNHPDTDILYSDAGMIDSSGRSICPLFKPQWNPESLISVMYPNHLTVYKRSLVINQGGLRSGFEGSQDYEMFLRLSEITDRIYRIPDILYYWRAHPGSTALSIESKPYSKIAAERALQDALERRNESGHIRMDPEFRYFEVQFPVLSKLLVSIVIVDETGSDFNPCIDSIISRTRYPEYEILVVSSFPENRHPEKLKRLMPSPAENSFGRLAQLAVRETRGDFLIFVNPDLHATRPDWIEQLIGQVQRKPIGAAGNLILDNDNRVYHAGILHGKLWRFQGMSYSECRKNTWFNILGNISALSGDCLACRKDVYLEAGGFDPSLTRCTAAVDFCFNLLHRNYRNVYIPHPLMTLNRSPHPQYVLPEEPQAADRDWATLKKRWLVYIQDDPCYNPNLSLRFNDYRIKNRCAAEEEALLECLPNS